MIKDVEFYENYSLKNFCTFKIGGDAKYIFVCHTNGSLLKICNYCKDNKIKYKVIGLGANLLFDDEGFNGAIIVNKSKNLRFKNDYVYVDGGVSIGNLINKCYLRGLSGLENLSGIPSTVAGAVVNNLGAFGPEFSDVVEYVKVAPKTDLNKVITLQKDKCCFAYRNSIFKNNDFIVLRVKIHLKKDEKHLIKERIASTIKKKVENQPLNYPSAGSIFKRTNVIPAKVIDELGLKGTKVGNAEISTKHAGFIVNLGNATSKDVKTLISNVKKEVFDLTGNVLENEIEFVD